MSIPYSSLHAAALSHVPAGTIKPTSTWIAILIHTITDVAKIQDQNDFLWLKCYGRITMRTLKHYYFTRHPLEEFELKFDTKFPSDVRNVAWLRKLSPIGPKSNVVVLRAFEPEAIAKETKAELKAKENAARAALGRKIEESGKTGGNPTDAIELIDESDDEYVEEEDEEEKAQRAKVSARVLASKKRKLAEAEQNAEDESDEEMEEDGPDRATLRKAVTDTNGDLTSGDEMMVDDDVAEDTENDVTPEPQANFLNTWDWNPFLCRLQQLPANIQDKINACPWCYCELCGKQMLMKPWTHFGRQGGALCTFCSSNMLENTGRGAEVVSIRDMCAEEVEAKRSKMEIGLMQNMDEDAGLDWPHELGNRNQATNGSAIADGMHDDDGDDDDEAESADNMGSQDDLDDAAVQIEADASKESSVAHESSEGVRHATPLTFEPAATGIHASQTTIQAMPLLTAEEQAKMVSSQRTKADRLGGQGVASKPSLSSDAYTLTTKINKPPTPPSTEPSLSDYDPDDNDNDVVPERHLESSFSDSAAMALVPSAEQVTASGEVEHHVDDAASDASFATAGEDNEPLAATTVNANQPDNTVNGASRWSSIKNWVTGSKASVVPLPDSHDNSGDAMEVDTEHEHGEDD